MSRCKYGISIGFNEEERESFRDRVRGPVLQPEDEGYDEARQVWNAMIDKEPALIARCRGAADVMASVDFAREHDLLLSVKGGGHNAAGKAVCDDGLMIDCSPMNGVRVDPDAQVVHVQAGATLADVDHETQPFGLATPLGEVSDTGVAGLALGGGWGWLGRKYGWTVDNIRAVELVTADGELVRASEDEHPELYWAIRGGSGNFGVVTSFEFDLHRIGDEVLAGYILYPVEDAREVLRFWRDFATDAPDAVAGLNANLMQISPGLPFPEEFHGRQVLSLGVLYAGPQDEGKAAISPLRDVGDPLLDTIAPIPYETWQQLRSAPEGMRHYWKGHFLKGLPDDAIDEFVEIARASPNQFSLAGFYAVGGAMNRVDSAETAFPHRDTAFDVTIQANWLDPDRDEELIKWARDVHETLDPYTTGGVYVNGTSEDEAVAAYGDNYQRLATVKAKWDPENLFRLNQNVEPAD